MTAKTRPPAPGRRPVRPVFLRLMLVVVTAAFGVQAVTGYVIAAKRGELKRVEQEMRVGLLMGSRARLLAAPLWKLQYEAADSLLSEMIDDPAIVSVVAIDSAGSPVVERAKARPPGDVYEVDEPILYQDGNIRTEAGRLHALITREPIATAFWSTLAQLIAIAVLSSAAIVVTIALATHLYVARPLKAFLRAIELSGEGDAARRRVDWRSADEFGAVAEAFNLMQGAAERSQGELVAINRKLDALARLDPLTDLANRRHLQEALRALTEEAGPHPFVLYRIDLDEFKEVNDTLGHGAGDRLLRHVAQQIRKVAGEDAMAARLGGDEFAVLQPACRDADEALAFARRLHAAISEPCRIEDASVRAKSSIGVAVLERRSAEIDPILSMADIALYEAKRTGRGRVQLLTADMQLRHDRRRAHEAALLAAFAQSQFMLVFQPQVRIADRALVGVEALVRWRHPERGVLAPSEFLATIGEMGLGAQLGAFVIAAACEAAGRLRDLGRPDIRVAINLSSEQLSDPALADQIEASLARHGLTCAAIELEITEGAMIKNLAVAREGLARLRARGAAVALDDFGTGYSSLSYIRQFPIDRIKIDRAFTREMPEIAATAAIVRAIRELARALDLSLLAEGVERPAEAAALAREGVELAQGYLYGAPAPFEDLVSRLREATLRRAG